MGFLSSTIDKSVFNPDSYKYAIQDGTNNGYAVLKIKPSARVGKKGFSDVGIIGIIQNPLQFSIEANWEEMGGITGMLPKVFGLSPESIGNFVNKGANIAGFASLGAVYASRKIYKKSGYLNINADLKIVNWNDDGSPVKSALILSYLMLPEDDFGKPQLDNIEEFAKKLGDKAFNGISNVADLMKDLWEDTKQKIGYNNDQVEGPVVDGAQMVDKVSRNVSNALEVGQEYLSKIYKTADDAGMTAAVKRSMIDNLEDQLLLRTSPTPVVLEVGNYFKQEDVIITNLGLEFSKEMTKTGPLYVDIKLTMSSRTILGDISDLGLYTTDNTGKRIDFIGQNGRIQDQNISLSNQFMGY